MVLTNFECWAHGGSGVGLAADIEHPFSGGSGIGIGGIGGVAASRHVDPFNPRAVQQTLGQVPSAAQPTAVSQISSNGYYGFSYVNSAHEVHDNNNDSNNNNNNNTINNNNNNNITNNNNNNTCNHNNNNTAGCIVNGAAARCKKRFFVSDDDLFANNIAATAAANSAGDADASYIHGHAKRCRYDDDFTAQYFNDFFNMQAATQIGTQSCLMDTEDLSQSQQHSHAQMLPIQQQQVDVAMATSLNSNYAPSNAYHSSLQPQQQQQLHQQTEVPQQQQVHFQGHLQRANRDVSRCMLSHMI